MGYGDPGMDDLRRDVARVLDENPDEAYSARELVDQLDNHPAIQEIPVWGKEYVRDAVWDLIDEERAALEFTRNFLGGVTGFKYTKKTEPDKNPLVE